MIDVKWAPLIGATVITRRAWDSLPAAQRDEMMKAAREAGVGMQGAHPEDGRRSRRHHAEAPAASDSRR